MSDLFFLERFGGGRFLEGQWEKEVSHIKGALTPAELKKMLDFKEVDSRLMSGSVCSPDLQILRNGRAFDIQTISPLSRSADLDSLVKHYGAGGSFRWQHLENYFEGIAKIANDLRGEIGFPVRANGYFSPASSKGLAPHFDSSDIFVLQIGGSKEWRLYSDYASKVDIPLYEDRFDPLRHQVTVKPREIMMEEGDILYIPKGHMHSAQTKSGMSVHVTFAVLSVSVVDLIGASLRKLARSEIELRKAVPTKNGSMAITDDLADLIPALVADARFTEALGDTLAEIVESHDKSKSSFAFGNLLA